MSIKKFDLKKIHQELSRLSFHPVLPNPQQWTVIDFSKTHPVPVEAEYGLGRFNENRPGLYSQDLFLKSSPEPRTVHMGIDLGSPAGTPVYAFADGEVHCRQFHSASGDYGGTLITKHFFSWGALWALFGHLSFHSLEKWTPLQKMRKGDVLGVLGTAEENGGWNPHLHFQISLQQPNNCDFPGVVAISQRQAALEIYLDPRWILGEVY